MGPKVCMPHLLPGITGYWMHKHKISERPSLDVWIHGTPLKIGRSDLRKHPKTAVRVFTVYKTYKSMLTSVTTVIKKIISPALFGLDTWR